MYPFLLEVSGTDIGHHIKQVKETLRRVPNRGIGYGILKYITPGTPTGALNFTLTPRVSFNYLGSFDEGGEGGFFEFAAESPGQSISPRMRRSHDLEVGGMMIRQRLHLSIAFNPGRHRRETVERLLARYKAELLATVEHCRHKKESEKTPGDFTYSELSVEEYEHILEKLG
jgi:non-ribosomal peptide synthase protein (TIGR01720 family)